MREARRARRVCGAEDTGCERDSEWCEVVGKSKSGSTLDALSRRWRCSGRSWVRGLRTCDVYSHTVVSASRSHPSHFRRAATVKSVTRVARWVEATEAIVDVTTTHPRQSNQIRDIQPFQNGQQDLRRQAEEHDDPRTEASASSRRGRVRCWRWQVVKLLKSSTHCASLSPP